MPKETSDYLIAYFDILGYSKTVSNISEYEESELITHIIGIAKKIYELKKKYEEGFPFKIYSFSDNFLIAVKIKNTEYYFNEFVFLIGLLQEVQFEIILYRGLFIRGSLVKGKLYAGKSLVYGKGLITAYEIEDKVAIYPRIIVDKQLLSELPRFFSDDVSVDNNNDFLDFINQMFILQAEAAIKVCFDAYPEDEISSDLDKEEKIKRGLKRASNVRLQKDMDGNYFINYLQQVEFLRYSIEDDNGNLDDNENFQIAITYLNLYTIRVLFSLYNNSNDNKIAEKYLWCCSHFNIFCIENDYQDLLIDIDMLRMNINNKEYIFELFKNTYAFEKILNYDNNISNIALASLLAVISEEIDKFF